MESLRNKVVIITGSSSGIGAACAVTFARHGARVVVCGRDQRRLDKVCADCRDSSATASASSARRRSGDDDDGEDRVFAVRGDLADEESCRRIVDGAVERFGGVDVLVLCAGYGITRGTEETTVADLRELWHVHVVAGCFLMTRLARPHLRRSGGNVVVISSLLALHPMPLNLAYAVTKAAQEQYVRLTAAELAADGVRVNAVRPGWVRTAIIERNAGVVGGRLASEVIFGLFDRRTPAGRCGTAAEIAEYTAYVAADGACGRVNGQCLTIDGGEALPYVLSPDGGGGCTLL